MSLLAPPAGEALVGPGGSEVARRIPWESAETARLLAGDTASGPLAEALASRDLALALTRSESLVASLRTLVPRVLAHDPAPSPETVHASRWLAAALPAVGREAPEEAPPCRPTEQEASDARTAVPGLGDQFLAIHPGSGAPSKNWTSEGFQALVDALSPESPWLLVEGPADGGAAEALRRHPRAHLAHDLPLRVLGALLSRARLFVGNDSGVGHLAAAWDAPTLALYGPTDPEVWSPVGSRVSVLRSPTGAMAELAPDAVIDAARRLWAFNSSGPGPRDG